MKYRILEHARMRYDTMSERERFLRVGKMAQLEKLEAFLMVAREKENRRLADLVKARIEQVKSFDNPGLMAAAVKAKVADVEPRREEVKSRSPKARDAKGAEVVVELERDIVL
jgi:hypothetical protein